MWTTSDKLLSGMVYRGSQSNVEYWIKHVIFLQAGEAQSYMEIRQYPLWDKWDISSNLRLCPSR